MIFGDLSDFSQIFHGIFLALQICFDPFGDPDLPQIFYKRFFKRSRFSRMFFDRGSMCQTGAAQMGFCFNAVSSIASTPLLLCLFVEMLGRVLKGFLSTPALGHMASILKIHIEETKLIYARYIDGEWLPEDVRKLGG
jgi:hypothetical protein